MNNDELIELYLGDKLPVDDKKAFEKRLKSDTALQEDLRLYKLARTAIHLGIKEKNKETFANLGAELLATKKKEETSEEKTPVVPLTPDPKGHPSYAIKQIYRIAAAFLVLVVAFLAFWFLKKDPKLTSKRLIAEHVATPLSEGEKSPDPSTQLELDNLSAQGIAFFEEKDFEQALRVYQARYNISKENSDLLYQGVSLLKLERYQEAIDILKRGANDFNLKDQFQWHLILAYFSSNDQREAFEDAVCLYAEKDYTYQKSLFLKLKEQEKVSCE